MQKKFTRFLYNNQLNKYHFFIKTQIKLKNKNTNDYYY